MVLERKPCVVGSGMLVAREEVTAKFGFVDIQLTDKPHYLPIAVATGNAQDWATDHARIMQPEHPVLGLMIKRFEKTRDERFGRQNLKVGCGTVK